MAVRLSYDIRVTLNGKNVPLIIPGPEAFDRTPARIDVEASRLASAAIAGTQLWVLLVRPSTRDWTFPPPGAIVDERIL
jgi:hypothetical protein